MGAFQRHDSRFRKQRNAVASQIEMPIHKSCPLKRRAGSTKATAKSFGFVEAIPSHILGDGMGDFPRAPTAVGPKEFVLSDMIHPVQGFKYSCLQFESCG